MFQFVAHRLPGKLSTAWFGYKIDFFAGWKGIRILADKGFDASFDKVSHHSLPNPFTNSNPNCNLIIGCL